MTWTTRLALSSDLPAVLEMCEAGVAENAPHIPFSRAAAEATFYRYLYAADPTIFVAERDGRVSGVAACSLHKYLFAPDIFVVLDTIYVRPDSRGTRAAACLVEQFLEWGQSLGAREWHAGTSTDRDAEASMRFFARFGAQPAGGSVKWIRR